MLLAEQRAAKLERISFNGHPPLGVNATTGSGSTTKMYSKEFQWAPTLGGECYHETQSEERQEAHIGFNGHPPLGVNATGRVCSKEAGGCAGFNGHPPLGVNATSSDPSAVDDVRECVSMGTHPWG